MRSRPPTQLGQVIGGGGEASEGSVGEVRSGLVPGHFCRTGDRTVQSLTKFLGPGPGTAMNRLYRSGPSPDRVQTVPALFIYLFIQD